MLKNQPYYTLAVPKSVDRVTEISYACDLIHTRIKILSSRVYILFIFIGKTRVAVLGPVQAGQTAGRDDDRAADGGDVKLPDRTDGDAAVLSADQYAEDFGHGTVVRQQRGVQRREQRRGRDRRRRWRRRR